jgi:hypothetical protein
MHKCGVELEPLLLEKMSRRKFRASFWRRWRRNKRTGSLIKDKLLARWGKLKMKREAFWGRETRALVLKDAWAERIGTHSRHGAAGIDGN